MASTASFETATGATYKSATTRRFIVVDTRDGAILYRTDDRSKAETRARKYEGFPKAVAERRSA